MSATETENIKPTGELALQTLAMPKDTNANGDIFGGWLVSQMDLAAGIASKKVTRGRSATVAIKGINFLSPVKVGATVSCFTTVVCIGRTSVQIQVDVWTSIFDIDDRSKKVADGLFVFVAIDDNGKPRKIPQQAAE
ncbi:MAG: acyl-CoA thioesterase [SAR86 cluster bacterium]|uniref:Acyl-CoA thioesterase n=1 Tax=SAR86 cluster bacterium TaxID=2030880 RepID=A0A2A5AUH2_9GAMM|nr:MAG: acyl-CoA thioesterase [SAR86 cluster bacterium]